MPGSKNSSSSSSTGRKTPQVTDPPSSYSQAIVSDSTRLDLIERDNKQFKEDFTSIKTALAQLLEISTQPKPSNTSSPKQEEELSDVSSLSKPLKHVSFDQASADHPNIDTRNKVVHPSNTTDVLAMDDSTERNSKHLSPSVTDGLSSEHSQGAMSNL